MTDGVPHLRLGTRGSALARRQTELVREALTRVIPEIQISVQLVQTEGDRNQVDRITDMGDKGVFVRAIERELLEDRIDVAVHSLKDVPEDTTAPGLMLAAYLPREDPGDVLVSRWALTLDGLVRGARVGTSSVRRRAQLLALRPDLQLLDIRGNVDTRLRKLDGGEYDAIVLAAAGLKRLGLEGRITEALPVMTFVPDAGQGIIACQARTGSDAARLLASIDDADSRRSALAERAVVRELGATCHSPVGAYSYLNGDRLSLIGMLASEDCSRLVRRGLLCDPEEPEAGGAEIARRLHEALHDASVY